MKSVRKDVWPVVSYFGMRVNGVAVVKITDGSSSWPLPNQYDVLPRSEQFDWGNMTPGVAQLAFAILADAIGSDAAHEWHVSFARDMFSGAPRDRWNLSKQQVQQWYETRTLSTCA
jgi:hypothetical protein